MACSIHVDMEGGWLEIRRPDDALRVRLEFAPVSDGKAEWSDTFAAALVRGITMLDDEYDVGQARGITRILAKILQEKLAKEREL